MGNNIPKMVVFPVQQLLCGKNESLLWKKAVRTRVTASVFRCRCDEKSLFRVKLQKKENKNVNFKCGTDNNC